MHLRLTEKAGARLRCPDPDKKYIFIGTTMRPVNRMDPVVHVAEPLPISSISPDLELPDKTCHAIIFSVEGDPQRFVSFAGDVFVEVNEATSLLLDDLFREIARLKAQEQVVEECRRRLQTLRGDS
jgi:hypothetical protein